MQSSWKWRRLFALLFAFALIAAACGDDDTASDDTTDGTTPTEAATATSGPADGTETPTEEPMDSAIFECPADQQGGDLTIATGAGVNTVSPYSNFGTGSNGGDFSAAIYDTLWRYDAETDTYSPNIGETLTQDDDAGTKWTLTLREGVTFGNGNTMTTADVKAHIEALAKTALRAAGMAKLVTSMDITDDRTMTFNLSAPFNMPYMLATEPGWVPDASAVAAAPVVEERSQYGVDLPTAIGSGAGPFEVTAITPGESIVLTAKDSYWGGRACADTLTFKNIAAEQAKIDAFTLGEIDVMFVNSVRQAATFDDMGALYYPGATGALSYVAPDQGLTGNGETQFNDVRLREALQLAVDYDVLNSRLYDDLSPRTTSAILPEESPLWYGVDGPPYDLERAKSLVAEVKAEGKWDAEFTYLIATTPTANDLGQALKAMWEAAGFKVTLEPVENTLLRIIQKNFEVSSSGFAVQSPGPWSTLNGLECNNVRQRTGFCDPEMDAALNKLRGALNTEEAKAALAEMQAVWNKTFPVVVLSHSVWGGAKQDYVGDVQTGPDSTPYFNHTTVNK